MFHSVLPHAEPETPRRRGDVGVYLRKLSAEYDLNLPWDQEESPSRRRRNPEHEITGTVSFLYFQDFQALEQAVEVFGQRVTPTTPREEKVSYLLGDLAIAQTNCLRDRRSRSSRRPPEGRSSSRSVNLPEPLSPTLGVKHAPKSSVEMPADDTRRLQARTSRKPTLKRPRSPSQSFTDKLKASGSTPPAARNLQLQKGHADFTTDIFPRGEGFTADPSKAASRRTNDAPLRPALDMPPPTITPSNVQKPGLALVNTSFESNALTSFNTSIWSDAQQGTQEEMASPATSVGESFHKPEGRGTGLGLDGANDVEQTQVTNYGSSPRLEDLRPSQSEHSRPTQRPEPRQSDFSEFGGSLASQDMEELFAKAAREATKDRELPPSPPKTDPQAGVHDLTGRERVKRIREDGLSSFTTPQSFLRLPLDLRLEAIRLLQKSHLTREYLEQAWSEPRTMDSLHELARRQDVKYERGQKTDFSDRGLAAKLRWSSKAHGRVYDLELLPLRKDKSNAFERRWGRHRFLVIDIEPPNRPPKALDLDGFGNMILSSVQAMFQQEQRFAGRIWRQFLVQPKKARGSKATVKGTLQVTFFAVRSEPGDAYPLPEITIAELMDWAVQFGENGSAPHRKMYSRLDLSASRTIPTITFDRSEIAYDIDDFMPTDEPDDTEFHDYTLPLNTSKAIEAMNDGCSRISTWAMREIQRILKLEHLPSVVQGRVFGAKGIWYRDDDDANLDQKPAKLIWISKSQIKVRQKESSYYDDHKVTFNVVQTNGRPKPSFVYSDCLPILTDRHVPKSAIEKAAKDSATSIGEDFLQAFQDRTALAEWVTRQRMVRETRSKRAGIDSIGGFPFSPEEQVLRMLVSGFEPGSFKHIASTTKIVFEQYLDWIRANFKMQLRNSTMLFGIADPKKVLKPGEVHVGFSRPFKDARQDRTNLRNVEALVFRSPALGAPDMQRVRCVYKEELSHLNDVVVFPSRGLRSLASKLQGGDYDGDQFMIIWEQSLVKHFRNAPVPSTEEPPEEFGIDVDRRKMGEMVQEYFSGAFQEQQVLHWINLNTEARMQPDPLGQITLLYEKIVYHDNSIATRRARKTLRLHDLIIDAAKQGYTLSASAWDKFKKDYRLSKVEDAGDPAHRKFTKGSKAIRQQTRSAKSKKISNISDYVYFEVIGPALDAALERTESIAESAKDVDPDLDAVFCQELNVAPRSSLAGKELVILQERLTQLKKRWNKSTGEFWNEGKDRRPWRDVVVDVRQEIESIVPETTSSELVASWMRGAVGEPTMWEKLRASCLVFVGATSKLMFAAAGYELCYLKAAAGGYPVAMRADSYAQHEPRKWNWGVDAGGQEYDEESEEEGKAANVMDVMNTDGQLWR